MKAKIKAGIALAVWVLMMTKVTGVNAVANETCITTANAAHNAYCLNESKKAIYDVCANAYGPTRLICRTKRTEYFRAFNKKQAAIAHHNETCSQGGWNDVYGSKWTTCN